MLYFQSLSSNETSSVLNFGKGEKNEETFGWYSKKKKKIKQKPSQSQTQI